MVAAAADQDGVAALLYGLGVAAHVFEALVLALVGGRTVLPERAHGLDALVETAPAVAVLARTRYVLDVDTLESAGATSVIAEEYESTLELVAETLRHFAVPEERIAEFATGLRAAGYEFMRGPAAQILAPWLAELGEQDGATV